MTNRPVFAVIDTETTGFSPTKDRIIELGVATLDAEFNEVRRWETLVHPGQRPIRNAKIHGISTGMVATAPRFLDIVTEFADVLDGLVVIAHNAGFDQRMLNGNFAVDTAELGKSAPALVPDIQDSLSLARRLLPGNSHKLGDLLTRFGLASTGAHSAGADAADTGAMLGTLYREYPGPVVQHFSAGRPFDGSRLAALGSLCCESATPRPRLSTR